MECFTDGRDRMILELEDRISAVRFENARLFDRKRELEAEDLKCMRVKKQICIAADLMRQYDHFKARHGLLGHGFDDLFAELRASGVSYGKK